jgi:hypothetical protein
LAKNSPNTAHYLLTAHDVAFTSLPFKIRNRRIKL